MFTLAAPYPQLQTTSLLPNPEFSDLQSVMDGVAMKRALDGTRYTYVKTRGGRRKFDWTFRLSRNKALELRAFIESYFASKVKIIDHHGDAWVGYLTGNPFEFDTPSRAAPAIAPMPRGELQAIQIQFEGEPL